MEVYIILGARTYKTTAGRYEWIVEVHADGAIANKRCQQLREDAKQESDPRVSTNYYLLAKSFIGERECQHIY